MGGYCNYALACDLPVSRPCALGHGVKGYLITAPNGSTFVAEATTGAFVGSSLKDVRKDMRGTTRAVARKQIAQAKRYRDQRLEVVETGKFWDIIGASEADNA